MSRLGSKMKSKSFAANSALLKNLLKKKLLQLLLLAKASSSAGRISSLDRAFAILGK
jgi:hypothetical protein